MNSFKLKELLSIKNGRDHKSLADGEIPVFGSGGLMRYVNQSIYEKESILLPRKGSLDNIQYTNKPFWTVDTLYYTEVNTSKANTYYLYNYLKQLDLSSLNSGTGVPSMTFGAYYDIEVKLPALDTQEAIASVLSSLDAKIELNNRINAELEAMAKTLYDYWFVQFDYPNELGKPYKSSGGKMVYNKELKREIPEGWEVKELSEITSMISRGISPKYLDEGGTCVINQKCVRQGTVLFEQARRNDENQRGSINKRVNIYDILVNSTGVGTLGRISLVRRLPEQQVTVDSHVTIVRCNEQLINQFYFGYTLLQKQLEIERFSLGSTGQVELSRTQLESIKVILPPEELQKNFEIFYRPICKQLANHENQNQQLASLRDWLLPMLMNGQVSVGEAQGKAQKVAEEKLD